MMHLIQLSPTPRLFSAPPPQIAKFLKAVVFFFALLLQTFVLSAQESALFTEVNPDTLTLNGSQQKVVSYVASLSHNGGVKYVQIGNLPSIQQNGYLNVTIPGFETTPHTFYAERVDYKSASEYKWTGKKSGDEGDFVFLSDSVGKLGFIDLGTDYYSIFSLGGNLGIVMKHDMSKYAEGECAGVSEENESMEEYCEDDDCGSAVVDVVVLITGGAETWLNANFGSFNVLYLSFGGLTINEAMWLSGVPNKFVRTRFHWNYTPTFTLTPENIGNDLDQLEAEQEQSFNSLKYQYRADIVVMLTDVEYMNGGDQVFGVANTLDPDASAKYCIVEVPFFFEPRFTFAHEIAHQFGCHHFPIPNEGEEDCAHGHLLELEGDVDRPTIMARTGATIPGTPGARILRFSNPDIDFAGEPTGIADERDNARIMRASMCSTSYNQPSPELFAEISGLPLLCGPNGTITSSNTYSAVILPPATGLPGVPPYTYEWRRSPDGVFNPGSYLGSGSSIQITQAFNCPSFFLRLKVTSNDGVVATTTRNIITALCAACQSPEDLIVTSASNLPNSTLPEWSATPNPSNGIITINVSQPLGHASLLRLFNQQGILLRELMVSGQDVFLLDASSHPSGIYFLALANADTSSVQKIVLQK